NDLQAFGGGIGQGLFAIDVLARAQGVHDDGLVQMVGYGDDHGVDGFLGQQFAMRGVGHCAAGAARVAFDPAEGAIETPFVGVDEAHDFGLRMLLERVHQLLPARAPADPAAGDAVAGGGAGGAAAGVAASRAPACNRVRRVISMRGLQGDYNSDYPANLAFASWLGAGGHLTARSEESRGPCFSADGTDITPAALKAGLPSLEASLRADSFEVERQSSIAAVQMASISLAQT